MRPLSVVALWCAFSLSCVAGEVKVPASPEPANTKKIIQFKLMTGKQYSLCRDYVDMLNKTRYTEIPVCERKILPEFTKFRAVKWTEITDKEEIRKIKKEQIRLYNLWPESHQENIETLIQKEEKKMDAGEFPLVYKAKVDMDHDGKNETVYQFSSHVPQIAPILYCYEVKSYLVIDDTNKETEDGYRMPYAKYGIGSGGVDIFYFDGRSFQSYWVSEYAKYQFKVNEISGIPNEVCGINIIQ